MELLICTSNLHKLEEIKSYTGADFKLISFRDLKGFKHPLEDAYTFQGNALIKAKAGYKKTGVISIGDDSGLEVLSLGHRPGVFSARYAGENATDAENNNKLLKELNGVKDRRARFVSSMAMVGPKKTIVVMGAVDGIILEQPKGKNGFGYDPLFYIPDLGKTMAELTIEEKNSISHRGKALKKLSQELLKLKNV